MISKLFRLSINAGKIKLKKKCLSDAKMSTVECVPKFLVHSSAGL